MPVEELFVTVQQLDNKYNVRGRALLFDSWNMT